MSPESVQAWFTPFHYFVYLGTIVVLMIVYYQWQWTDKCKRFIKVLVVKPDGSTDTAYCKKSGNFVELKDPNSKATTRMWAVTKLSTFDMWYPGDGFIPKIFQKTIRTTIVDEDDWEPLLNRGSYSENVASPDVKKLLYQIAGDIPDPNKSVLLSLVGRLNTAPTREMIGSPALLGNLATEKISELVTTVAKDIINPLQEAIKKMGQRVNPTVVYIGLGLIAILLVFTVFMVKPLADQISEIVSQVAIIKTALGVK